MQTENRQPAPSPASVRFALRHQALLLATMIVSSAMCVFLFGVRWVKTGQTTYSTLNVNLILAWIPVMFAWIAYNVYRKGSCLGDVIAIGCAVVWLLFFPNAPYLITDLVHLHARPEMPYWFDQILYMAFAFTGCYLGMVSLILMQALVRRWLGWVVSWVFALGALVLGGFRNLHREVPALQQLGPAAQPQAADQGTPQLGAPSQIQFRRVYLRHHLLGLLCRNLFCRRWDSQFTKSGQPRIEILQPGCSNLNNGEYFLKLLRGLCAGMNPRAGIRRPIGAASLAPYSPRSGLRFLAPRPVLIGFCEGSIAARTAAPAHLSQ